MRRKITSLMLVVACFFGSVHTASAKQKPILERIEARVVPISISVLEKPNVTIVIYEYSTGQELRNLAQAFAKGGKEGLGSALGKMKKGTVMQIPGLPGDLPVELVESKSDGASRRLTIVAERGQSYTATRSMQIDHLGQGYPYICIQIEFDEAGNGKGEIVQYARLAFDSEGHLTINRWNTKPFQLVDVRSSK